MTINEYVARRAAREKAFAAMQVAARDEADPEVRRHIEAIAAKFKAKWNI